MNKLFDVEKLNLISDNENYYFFRSLEPGDIEDIEKGIIVDGEEYLGLRTDSQRWEETHEEGPRWNSNSEVSLEEMYSHIKMHYSLQTNCISLSSNANVAKTYSQAFSNKYVMIKVPKSEMGSRVFHAGQYMLDEIQKRVEEEILNGQIPEDIRKDLEKVDQATTSKEIRNLIKVRYTSKEELDINKKGLRKGIVYKSPQARVSSYQSLDEEQTLEKNKIIAKLTILERKGIMKPLIKQSSNNNLLIQTVGSAFSSSEQIYYGEIEEGRVIDLPEEILNIFGLLQQVEGEDKNLVDELKREVVEFVVKGKHIEPQENLRQKYSTRKEISIDEMYELFDGKIEYGKSNSIAKNMFYMSKGQLEARSLAKELRKIVNDNPKFDSVIAYIENNGFVIEPVITTRLNHKGYKLSEAVNLNLRKDEIGLVEKIRDLTDEEQEEVLESGGLSNVRNIITDTLHNDEKIERISKEDYYAEAIFSSYDWKKIEIEEFKTYEKNNLIKRIKDGYCIELYKKLEENGTKIDDIPKVLLNIITRKNDFEITEEDTEESIKEKRLDQYDRMIKENISEYNEELSIERVERFLGYYDVPNTELQLRPYQQRTVEKVNEIFESERFASVILPTGGGKSFVSIEQLLEHKDEEILYLAPQNEILEQMKDYIIKYVHGPANTIGRDKDEIIKDVFPNIKFETYPGLLAKKGDETINKEYGFVVLDELHRTGASEWGDKLNTLLDNQSEKTKVLGITATPRRDSDGRDMSNEIAERLGYTNKEAVAGKHIAMNMSLVNAIRMGLVVNPKLVSCAYNLRNDERLERIEEKINSIEDLQERNEKLEKYEKLRRNIEEAEGVSEILQSNVKKGGKYIVFLPVIGENEDEDGNAIKRKSANVRIEEYEKQLEEYFKDSDIKPKFHSILGKYGNVENAKRLEEFENANTDDTEFMLVINKANEGLHISELDGIVWLRPMDENSRTLYLQQLGRVIYSEDPDNLTKEEDRPVVIDLVNNTLKVNWQGEVTEKDDIELLSIIVDWTEEHDGTLPDINSTDREETGYATVLKEIQGKYENYLDGNFKNLNEKQIEEVQEILRLGSIVNLWQAELSDRIIGEGRQKSSSTFNKDVGPFELIGIEKDLVDVESELDGIELTIEERILKFI